jgi:LEA14-like dessication related protein
MVLMLAVIAIGGFKVCSKGNSGALNTAVTITDIHLSDISSTKTTVAATIEIKNNNSIEATLEKVAYDVSFGHKGKWILLGHGEKGSMDLKATSTTNFVITPVIENSNGWAFVTESLLGTDPSNMKVEGDAWLKVGTDSSKIHFQKVVTYPEKTQAP